MFQTETTLWEARSLIASAAATVVVAVFAALQLWREFRRDFEHRRNADSRTSAHAYILREDLCEWIERHGDPYKFAEWVIDPQHRRIFDDSLRNARHRCTRLLALSTEASPWVSIELRKATIALFGSGWHLFRYLDLLGVAAQLSPEAIEEWRIAATRLNACIRHLEAVHPDLPRRPVETNDIEHAAEYPQLEGLHQEQWPRQPRYTDTSLPTPIATAGIGLFLAAIFSGGASPGEGFAIGFVAGLILSVLAAISGLRPRRPQDLT